MIARMPLDRPPEHMILTRRAENLSRAVFEEKLYDQAKISQRIAFESSGDAKIRANTIKARTQEMVAGMDAALDARRAKLAALLEAEDEAYAAEAMASAETPTEKLAKMRSRAKALRDKREAERSALAETQSLKLWETNCEPLRTAMSTTERLLINDDHKQQMEWKAKSGQMEAEVDALYAACWEADRIAKEERDQRDVATQLGRNRATQAVQITQMEETQQRAHLEKMETAELQTLRLETAKEIEAELLEEERRKHAKQATLKRILDRDTNTRAEYAAIHKGEELADEFALLERLEKERRDVQHLAHENKKAAAAEAQAYFRYLEGFASQRANFEAIIDAAVADAGERVWQDRLTKMRAERAHRKEIVADILQARKAQMAYHVHERQAEDAAKIADKQRIDADVAAFAAETAQLKITQRHVANSFQSEIVKQHEEFLATQAADRAADAAAEQALQSSYKATDTRIDLAVTAVRMNATARK